MALGSHYLTFVAVGAVGAVLMAGLWNMTRNDSASMSQTLMRWRVGLQFVAIIALMLALYMRRGA